MDQTTEAAALLRTGALYTRRVGLLGRSGDLTFAGIKRGAFSIYEGDGPIYHFDLEGRWQRAFIRGVHYRKALDNSVVAIDRVREGANLVLKRRPLPFAEVADLDASIRDAALSLADRMASEGVDVIGPPDPVRPLSDRDLRDMLDLVAPWDASAWFSHRERYLSAYGPIGFLPPDAHQAVVLQATVGDARAQGFGGGPGVEHAERTPSEFAAHARTVRSLLGRRILQNNGVFLGEADVLRRPEGDVIACLEALAETFPIRRVAGSVHVRDRAEDEPFLAGVDVFVDDFSPGLPDRRGLSAMRAAGLRRVNLGVVSGYDALRRESGASWLDGEALSFAEETKAAGLTLGVIVLVGTDEATSAGRHVAATTDLVNALAIGPGDLVYLIDANEVAEGVGLEDREAVAEQTRAIKEGLGPARSKGAKVVPYSMEKQWN